MSAVRAGRRLLTGLGSALVIATGPAPRAAPAEPACPKLAAAPGLPGGDAQSGGTRLRPGMRLDHRSLLLLQHLLPVELWRLRDTFFHEDMALEVGPCHRVYALAAAYERATRAQAGSASLDAEGNLDHAGSGLPFPPAEIDPHAADAGLRWAWNVERRHRGPGLRGGFRLVDMPGALGGVGRYAGEWSFFPISHRPDLPAPDAAPAWAWIAGGRFAAPSAARHLAWQQLRPAAADRDFELSDDIFVYVPSLRKVRRAASSWVDGLYMPRYRAGAPGAGAGSGSGIQVSEPLRRGFEGLALRPNAYRWRRLREQDVLAPLNVSHPGYPVEPRRHFGPSGLSLGSDRWDVRRVVVIQGALRAHERDFDFLTLYVDVQTQQPLYVITRRRGEQLVDVGVLAHRYSGDQSPGPRYPDGSPVNAFAPVAALFYDARDGSGWRRESYDLRMTAPTPEDLQSLLSQHHLSRGR